MLDKFDIKYERAASKILNWSSWNSNKYSLTIVYKDAKLPYARFSNINNIYFLTAINEHNTTCMVGLKVTSFSPIDLEDYKYICLYDRNGLLVPEDILDCFSWVIEKDYINKIEVFK